MAPSQWVMRRTENAVFRWEPASIETARLRTRKLESLVPNFSKARRQALLVELRQECRPYRLDMSYQDIEGGLTVYALAERVADNLRMEGQNAKRGTRNVERGGLTE